MTQTALRRGSQNEGNSDYFTGCPIGGGFIWFGLLTKIPSNCRVCDNSTLAISSFAKLSENLGNSWGASGGNLNLPDLRGKFPRGVDGGAANDPDRATRTANATGGNTGDNVGSVQDHAIQGHGHDMYVGNTAAGFGHGSANSQLAKADVAGGRVLNSVTGGTKDEMQQPITLSPFGTANNAAESRPKNANVYFVIRVN